MTTQSTEANVKHYELMVIIAPNIGEEKTNKELDKIRDLLKSFDGKILNEDIWGHRDLAYRINKFESGYYAVFNFESTFELLPELNKTLTIEGNILRFLVVKPPKGYAFKSQSDYDQEAEDRKSKEAEIAEASLKKSAPKKKAAPKKVEEKKEEKAETVEKAPAEKKEAPKKKAAKKEESKKSMAELDEKLKSIIDDSDINL